MMTVGGVSGSEAKCGALPFEDGILSLFPPPPPPLTEVGAGGKEYLSLAINRAIVFRTTVWFSTIHQPEATSNASAVTCSANESARCEPRTGNAPLSVMKSGETTDSRRAADFG
jgi:hypothetical protein